MTSTQLITPAIAILQKYFIFDRIFDLVDYDLNMEQLHNDLQSLRKDRYEPNYRFIFLHYDTEYYISQDAAGLTLTNLQKILESLDISNYFCLILSHQRLQSMCVNAKQNIIPYTDCSMGTITNHLHGLMHPVIENIKLDLNEECISAKYISLNGAGRFHRRILVSLLQDRNLLESGMVSYHGESYFPI